MQRFVEPPYTNYTRVWHTGIIVADSSPELNLFPLEARSDLEVAQQLLSQNWPFLSSRFQTEFATTRRVTWRFNQSEVSQEWRVVRPAFVCIWHAERFCDEQPTCQSNASVCGSGHGYRATEFSAAALVTASKKYPFFCLAAPRFKWVPKKEQGLAANPCHFWLDRFVLRHPTP